MKSRKPRVLLVVGLLGLASANVHADLITGIESIVDANTTTFSGFGGSNVVLGGASAGVVLNGLQVTTNCTTSIICTSGFGYSDTGINFEDNGHWLAGFAGVGAFDEEGRQGFKVDLGSNFSAVGAFVNYYWYGYFGGGPNLPRIATIKALDENLVVLESYNLFIAASIFGNEQEQYGITFGHRPETADATNGDAGAFRGITRETADIRYLLFQGSGLFAHSITVGSVPEPATLGLLGLGLAGVGFTRRKKVRINAWSETR